MWILYYFIITELLHLLIHAPAILKGESIRNRCYIGVDTAIGIGTGVLQGVVGFAQKLKAAKLARANGEQPELEDDPYLDDGYKRSLANAGQGLSENAKQAFLKNNDRNLSSSLDTMLKLGGGSSLVSDLYDRGGSALQGFALAEEKAWRDNQQIFAGYEKAKASENRDEWYINKFKKWSDKNAAIEELSKQGMTNIWKGINTAGGSVIKSLNPYASKKATGDPGSDVQGGQAGQINPNRALYKPMTYSMPKLGGLSKVPGAGPAQDDWLFGSGGLDY